MGDPQNGWFAKANPSKADDSVGVAHDSPIWLVVWNIIFFPYIGNNHPK